MLRGGRCALYEMYVYVRMKIKHDQITKENLYQGLLLCLVGVAVGQISEALLETSTPVPILRFL